ncbi:hypothetical protein CPT_MarsHill_186 [Staphylococcus phage MarsHill]|nr:hypothetical protein CPT_MarsHill_186 [Staphylococcus phage MarsHill]
MELLESKHLLTEDAMTQRVLQEFSLPFRPFKRLEPEEKMEALSVAISKTSEKMLKKSGNKNLKSILSSKGDFKKIKAYKDFEKTFNYIKSQKSNSFDPKLISVFDTIENSVNLLEKEKNNFKKCFNNGNEVGQIVYTTLASTVMLLTSQLFFLGFSNEDGKLQFDDKKLKNKNSLEVNTLENVLKMYKAGKLKDIFKFDGSFVSANEEFNFDDIVDLAKKAKDSKFLKDNKLLTNANNVKKAGIYGAITISAIAGSMLALYLTKQAYIKVIKTRSDIAEYLREAVKIIEGERNNDLSDKAREKQNKATERLNKLADKIDIDSGVAEVQGKSESEQIDAEIGKELETDFNISF